MIRLSRWRPVGPRSAKIGSSRGSLDHLVGDGEQRRRHVQANRLRHDQVNDEVDLVDRVDRKIGGLRPSKILSTKSPGAPLKSMKATVSTRIENSYFS